MPVTFDNLASELVNEILRLVIAANPDQEADLAHTSKRMYAHLTGDSFWVQMIPTAYQHSELTARDLYNKLSELNKLNTQKLAEKIVDQNITYQDRLCIAKTPCLINKALQHEQPTYLLTQLIKDDKQALLAVLQNSNRSLLKRNLSCFIDIVCKIFSQGQVLPFVPDHLQNEFQQQYASNSEAIGKQSAQFIGYSAT